MDVEETIRVAVTDQGWYDSLRHRDCRQGVNFWRPSDKKVKIKLGEWLLFKLHSAGKVVGGAQFLTSELLTINQAWQRWGTANGCADKDAFLCRLIRLRAPYAQELQYHSYIRCLYLDKPVFLNERNWFDAPGWHPKNRNPIPKYEAGNSDRDKLQRLIEERFSHNRLVNKEVVVLGEKATRNGQNAFRKEILENYQGQCAITHEKTEPVLEAAHIEPYAKSQNHLPSNGLLLKSDIHKLFDKGLVSVTPDRVFHVSPKIKEEWDNGKYYYELDGEKIDAPSEEHLRPNPEHLQEHYEKRFKK